MTQFEAFQEGIEVNGTTIQSVIDGMGVFKKMASHFLQEAGLPEEIIPDDKTWYSQQQWLDAFKLIAKKVGPKTLTSIGKSIPRNAIFPPGVDTIEKGLASIDVAYHMNHRNGDGEVLFNHEDGTKKNGIGNYHFEKVTGKNLVEIVCDNPYPCDFDKGIIITMANRFDPTASVKHVDSSPCRKLEGLNCTYHVTWR